MTLQNFTLGTFAQQGVAAGSFESIATTTVGTTGTSTITFSSIPSTYTHLQLRGFWFNSTNSNNWFRVNGDTGTNYNGHELVGDGASVSASAYTTNSEGNFIGYSDAASANPTTAVIDILDYANTNKFKTVRVIYGQDRNGSGRISMRSSSWRSTSAITSINLYSQAGTFNQYTHFALYGIKAA